MSTTTTDFSYLKAEISLLISSTSSSVTPWFSDLRCSCNPPLLCRYLLPHIIISNPHVDISYLIYIFLTMLKSWRKDEEWYGTSVTYRRTRFCIIASYCSSFSLANVILCWSSFILMRALTIVMMMIVMVMMVFTFTDMARCLRSRLVFPVQQRNRK